MSFESLVVLILASLALPLALYFVALLINQFCFGSSRRTALRSVNAFGFFLGIYLSIRSGLLFSQLDGAVTLLQAENLATSTILLLLGQILSNIIEAAVIVGVSIMSVGLVFELTAGWLLSASGSSSDKVNLQGFRVALVLLIFSCSSSFMLEYLLGKNYLAN